ncbi:MAG: 3-hydroxyacyl-CoA dehydrogenase NAD-binding domain-containing protein [Proteobacteria bacterium]|nr:3-hydroxyacyl-CoA dehydrogenase NAD-binding domain-containing protein [Pseudomonadota bacterium]
MIGASDIAADGIAKAGVIGLGTMGQGITLVLARAGIEVVAIEADDAKLDAGLEALAAGLKDRVQRGRMTEDAMDAELSRISGSTSLDDLHDADLVIEAAIEDMTVKKDIFKALYRICPPHAILASNTSSLSIDEIATATSRPEMVAGAHFFAPAQVMKLLEIVRGAKTSPEVMAALMALSKRAGKIGVAVGNGPGFVGNRMYHRYTWQAYFLLQEGCEPIEVDTAMQGFGFALGCLAVGDISGLDVARRVRQGQIATGDINPTDPYPVIADRICDEGWLGRKTGRGWYRYENSERTPDPEVSALIQKVAAELGIGRRQISAEEIQDRCIFALINEGARLLGNGVAGSPDDIDVIWRFGYGFPEAKGGPMKIARQLGREHVLATLSRLHAAHGPAFEPAAAIADPRNKRLFR